MTKENTKGFNIKWAKDRGVDILVVLWHPAFHGDRFHDLHTTLAEKTSAPETTRY